jgi:hypothetical protein
MPCNLSACTSPIAAVAVTPLGNTFASASGNSLPVTIDKVCPCTFTFASACVITPLIAICAETEPV